MSLHIDLESPGYNTRSYGQVDVLDVSAILDGDRLSVFAVNRGVQAIEALIQPLDVSVRSVESAECVTGSDLGATNSLERQDAVSKREFDGIQIQKSGALAKLPGHSFTAATFVIS